MNRARKIRAIIDFLKWQVGSRLVPGAIVYDWINGSKFLVRVGETGLTGNIYTGLHEFSDMSFLLHYLRPEDLFVDVGANVGSYTILACSAIGARGIAFEPVPITYSKLKDNIRLNRLDETVTCINKGVGAQPGTIAFTVDCDTTNHALAENEQTDNSALISVTTLDTVLGNETPALIKIDVEGYESPVLEGATQVLQKDSLSAVIMELNGSGTRYGFDEEKVASAMFDLDFRAYSYDPFARRLIPLSSKNSSSGNTLFLRNLPLVEKRLRSAPTIAILGREL